MNFETYVLIGIVCALLLVFWIFRGTDEQREYEKKLKESLLDEYIIDPETGAKLTLEEAESGHWVAHDNEFRTMPESEIDKLFSEEEKNGERAINYLKEQTNYRKQSLTDEDIELLEKTKTLSKYDAWSYSNSFRIEFCEGMVFLPAVYMTGNLHSYYSDDYEESQILFWIKLDFDFGHYYLREKTEAEAFFDTIKGNDDLILTNYESFTFKKTDKILLLQSLVKKLEGQGGLEIEFLQKNLFIKNLKYVNTEDLMRMEKLVKNCMSV